MRLTVSIALALIVCGCAQRSTVKLDVEGMRRPSPVADCISDLRERGQPTDRPIDLDQKLRADLMAMAGVREQQIQEPLCWYETPSGEVFLRASSICGSPMEFHFRNVASAWSLARVDVGFCDQRT